MARLEKQLEDDFVTFAESKGCLAIKLRTDGVNGFPDRTVLTPYGVFFVEFKRSEKDELRPAQKVMKRKLEGLGYLVAVAAEKGYAAYVLNGFLMVMKSERKASKLRWLANGYSPDRNQRDAEAECDRVMRKLASILRGGK